MKVKEFEFNAKEAENKATINSLQAQLQAAKAEAANYVQQLNLERTASIERAKASSVGHINIGTPTNSR
jgi:molecular chaperone GrpE (heat shock protein)